MTAAPLLHVRDGRRFTAHVRDGRRFAVHVRDGAVPAGVPGAILSSSLRIPATTTTGTLPLGTPEAIPWYIAGGTNWGGRASIATMKVLPPDPGWRYTPGPARGGDGKALDILRLLDSAGHSWDWRFYFGLYVPQVAAASVAIGEDGIWVASTGGQVQWAATGGTGPYTWEMVEAPTGGSVTAGGLYTAGAAFGWDRLKVTDSLGAIAYATVQVDPMTFPTTWSAEVHSYFGEPAIPYGFVAPQGGTAPYTVSIETNATGATLVGPRPLRAVIRLTDYDGAPADLAGWAFEPGRLYSQRGLLMAEGLAVTTNGDVVEVALPLPSAVPYPTAVLRSAATTAGGEPAVIEALLVAKET